MPDDDNYLRSLLVQATEAYTILSELKDVPGDLDTIKKQLGKIEGTLKVLCNKIEELDYSSDDYVELSKAAKFYLENYDFYKVIDAYQLYSEDSMRIKNMRLSILTALQEKDLILKIRQMLSRI